MTDDGVDMDEAELLHLAHAALMLDGEIPEPAMTKALGHWRRRSLAGGWKCAIPLYMWITVKHI